MTDITKTGALPVATAPKPPLLRVLLIAGLFSLVCLVWATTWIGIKLTIASIPPLTAAGVRFLITFSVMLVILRATKNPLFFPSRKRRFFWFVTVFYFGFPYFLMNYGEQFIAPGLAALIFSAMPIFSLIFSALLLRERSNGWQMLGIAIGFAGFAMIFRHELASSKFGSIAGIAALGAAALLHGFCYTFTKRYGGEVSVVTYNTLPIGLSGLAMTLSGLALEQTNWAAVTTTSWIALGYLALSAVVAFLAYFYLLKIMSPVVASYSYLIFPVLSIFIDSKMSGTPIDPQFLVFAAVILGGFAITKVATSR